MSLFSYSEHAANSPDTWTVKKHGRKWGLFAMNSENPLDSFETQREAIAATTSGRAFDLYHKERRWYAGESIPGWKPFSPPVKQPQTPLEWSALWSAMQANYNAKSDAWTETTEHMFDEMLNAVPPRAQKRGAFLNGEEWTHDANGNGVFSAFREMPGNRYEAKYMTLAEFRSV